MRAAFAFDPDRCTACEACRVACGVENAGGRDTGWRQLFTLNPARHPDAPTRHLSLACNHCQTPACLLACPARAYRRDEAMGAVLVDPDRCLGCRYCTWVCPYDAPRFDEAAGVVGKCTLCATLLARGERPACVRACPTGALSLVPRESSGDGAEAAGPGLVATTLGPALAVRPSTPRAWPAPSTPAGASWQPRPTRRIRLRSEWGLAVLTVTVPALLAWLAAGLVRPVSAPPAPAFAIAGALALALSTVHLGRPLRAWRAALGLGTSWLSREVVLLSAFLGLGTVSLAAGPRAPAWLGRLAVGSGLAALLAVDGVYRAIPRLGGPRALRPGEAWLSGLLLLGLAVEAPLVWAPAAALSAALALSPGPALLGPLPPGLWWPRLALLAAAAALASSGVEWPWPLLAALAGEALERVRFYLELEPVGPAWEMAERAGGAHRPGQAGPGPGGAGPDQSGRGLSSRQKERKPVTPGLVGTARYTKPAPPSRTR